MNTLVDLLELQATRQGHAPAILAPGRSALSYAQLYIQVVSTVESLRQLGIRPQDRIALVLPNGPTLGVLLLATSCAAIGAPLHPGYTAAEFEFYLTDLAATAVIVATELDSPVRAVARARGILLLEVSCLGETAGIFALTQVLDGNRAPVTRTHLSQPQDIALLLHTSGSTAQPKLVPLTQHNLCTSAQQIVTTLYLSQADCCLNVMPLWHIHSLVGALLATLVAGGSIVCAPGYDPATFPSWLTQFQPTWYTAVPTIHQAILAQATSQPIPQASPSLRFIRSSSAALSARVMDELEQIFQVPVIEAYGMTETAGQICSNPLPPGQRKAGSVGLAAGPIVAIMAAESDSLLAPGECGEIVVRGASVMAGYANQPADIPAAFSQDWLRTGDQGYLDADGYLFISGRIKEVINRGGEKVAPREVEEVLLQHPAVAQAVTFGVAHATLGEDVNTAVVLRPGHAVTARDLRDFVYNHLATYKVPTQIMLVSTLPLGASGKVQRKTLAAMFATQPAAEFVAPAGPIGATLATIWAEVLGKPLIGAHDNFFALGGNSLLAMLVVARTLALLNVAIRPSHLFASPSIAELAEVILLDQLAKIDPAHLRKLLAEIEQLDNSSQADAGMLLTTHIKQTRPISIED